MSPLEDVVDPIVSSIYLAKLICIFSSHWVYTGNHSRARNSHFGVVSRIARCGMTLKETRGLYVLPIQVHLHDKRPFRFFFHLLTFSNVSTLDVKRACNCSFIMSRDVLEDGPAACTDWLRRAPADLRCRTDDIVYWLAGSRRDSKIESHPPAAVPGSSHPHLWPQ